MCILNKICAKSQTDLLNYSRISYDFVEIIIFSNVRSPDDDHDLANDADQLVVAA